MLTEKDRKTLAQRKKVLGALPVFAIAIPLLWVGVMVFMWTQHPQLVNPGFVGKGILANDFAREELETMALITPVVSAALLGFVLLVFVIAYVALKRERRWIELIERMDAERQGNSEA